MSLRTKVRRAINLAMRGGVELKNIEHRTLMLGKLLAESAKSRGQISALSQVEFSVFSQFGDDGIIQWLVHRLDIRDKLFIEFGVEDYRESNTRFLMMNDNWSGLVMDGSPQHVSRIQGAEYFWRHDLTAKCVFIDKDNINALIGDWLGGRELGILHIDLDGNDYWIWQAITVRPAIVILEYNSVFGCDRAITVPYDPSFVRSRAHSSNLYFGASLPALHRLSVSKGYTFVGCNGAGNNAYFVRNDQLRPPVVGVSLDEGYVESKYRESRSPFGELTLLSGPARLRAISGMPVFDVATDQLTSL